MLCFAGLCSAAAKSLCVRYWISTFPRQRIHACEVDSVHCVRFRTIAYKMCNCSVGGGHSARAWFGGFSDGMTQHLPLMAENHVQTQLSTQTLNPRNRAMFVCRALPQATHAVLWCCVQHGLRVWPLKLHAYVNCSCCSYRHYVCFWCLMCLCAADIVCRVRVCKLHRPQVLCWSQLMWFGHLPGPVGCWSEGRRHGPL